MPELIDCQWYAKHTASAQTLAQIEEIAKWQHKALKDNHMPVDNQVLSLELDGDNIEIEASSAVNALEIYQEIFRDHDHEIVPGFSACDKNTIIDLGANYGFYSLSVKRQNPECRITSLEPNKYIFPMLEKNLAPYKNVTLINAAIGTEDMMGDFEVVRQIPSIGGLTLRQVQRKWLTEDLIEKYSVRYMSLQSIMSEYGVDYCDILKVDVEGVEGVLFDKTPDKTLKAAERIVVERHTPEIGRQVINRLSTLGFKLVYDQDPECQKHYGNLYFAQT